MKNEQELQTLYAQLNYPPEKVEEPIIYRLVVECGVIPNIRRANVDREIGGYLVLTLTGTPAQLEAALRLIEEQGVKVTRMEV